MQDSPPADAAAKPSRIQQRNRTRILDAALDVFSQHGFRGATLDQIAQAAGLSKPNILYYFSGKEEIHVTLLNGLMDTWLAPMREIDPEGDPLTFTVFGVLGGQFERVANPGIAISSFTQGELGAGQVISGLTGDSRAY